MIHHSWTGNMEGQPNEQDKVNTHISIVVPEEYAPGLRGIIQRIRRRNWRHVGENMKENLLLILLLGSVVLGCLVGFAIRSTSIEAFGRREIMYLQFPGEILMRMLKMLILPLVVSSLISGIAGLDAGTCGKMGLRTIAYFASTTLLAVVLGIIMTYIIRPGANSDKKALERFGSAAQINPADTFLDLIRNMFPDNLVVASYNGFRSKEVHVEYNFTTTVPYNESADNSSYYDIADGKVFNISFNTVNGTIQNVTKNYSQMIWEPGTSGTNSMNVLGLVVFSVLMGVILSRMGTKGKPLMDFCTCLAEASMKIFVIFIWYSPIGITFLIAGKIVEMESFAVMLGQVGVYFLTVLVGLFIHGSIVLPLLFFLLTRNNPYKFMYGISQAMATAFGTSSSSATMPVTLHCLEVNNHVDPRVSTFVIPVGATINMDGTALYEAVAALFIANVNGITMDFGNVVTISITATAASIGAAGVPQAGLVTMVIVLSAVGLPVDDITLILVVDWFLDRFRTMTNVTGDSLGAGIVYHLSKHELPPLDQDKTEAELAEVNVENFPGQEEYPGQRKAPNGTEGPTIAAV